MSDNVKNTPQKTKKKSNKIVILLALVLALAVVSFFAYSYLTKSFVFADESEEQPVVLQVCALEEFVVNLKNPSGSKSSASKHYLKTKIALGFENDKDTEMLTEKQMQIRDVIIQTLRSKTTDEIMVVEKTDDIKKELMENVNELFEPDLVLDIYIIDFLIQ